MILIILNQNEYIRNVSCVSRCHILLKRYVVFFLWILTDFWSHGFLIDSYGFLMDFLWIPYEFPMEFHMISKISWTSYGFPMGSHWRAFDFSGFPMDVYGLSMDFVWISHGNRMEFLYVSHWFLMEFLWISYEFLKDSFFIVSGFFFI